MPPIPVELPVDELAFRLLKRLFTGRRNNIHRATLTAINRLYEIDINTNSTVVRRVIGEAFDWLFVHGLIAEEPSLTNGVWYITGRGEEYLNDPTPSATIRASTRLDLDLHPLIAKRVRSQFILGEYEAAVLMAFREVEIRVRDMGQFENSLIGVKLMHRAFSPENGVLRDDTLDKGEQQANMELFAGAIGAFKNPSSHRQVDYGDATVAAEAVLLADLLLRILDRYDQSPPS